MRISTSFRETDVGNTGAWACNADVNSTTMTKAAKIGGFTFSIAKRLDTADVRVIAMLELSAIHGLASPTGLEPVS